MLLLLLLYVNSTKIGWIFDKHIEIVGWKNGSFFQDCCLQHGPRSWSYTVCRTCHGRVLASFSQIARAEAQFSQSEGKHWWTRVGKMDRSFPRYHVLKKGQRSFQVPDGPQRKKTLADSLVEAGYGGAISNGVWALIFYGLNRKNKKLLCGGYCISMIYGSNLANYRCIEPFWKKFLFFLSDAHFYFYIVRSYLVGLTLMLVSNCGYGSKLSHSELVVSYPQNHQKTC